MVARDDRVSQQTREIVAFLFAIAAFTIFILWLWIPLWHLEQSLNYQIDLASQELRHLEQRPDLANLPNTVYTLPSHLDNMFIMQFLENVAILNEVIIGEISFGSASSANQLLSFPVRLRINGGYHNIAGFLGRLENPEQHLMQVISWNYGSDGSEAGYTMNLELVFWGQSGGTSTSPPAGGSSSRSNPFVGQ